MFVFGIDVASPFSGYCFTAVNISRLVAGQLDSKLSLMFFGCGAAAVVDSIMYLVPP